jgi:hypothetical protein
LRRADRALYIAKAKGRDCVVDGDMPKTSPMLKVVSE